MFFFSPTEIRNSIGLTEALTRFYILRVAIRCPDIWWVAGSTDACQLRSKGLWFPFSREMTLPRPHPLRLLHSLTSRAEMSAYPLHLIGLAGFGANPAQVEKGRRRVGE